ncbi:uncharacterized protein BT62DRAFT_973158 [Guyanagaster necrorhizus]|uniref:Uncharacterized protein n=1 Tax=Guyanagaster necrorhizus TaxID=856835 RepID=A0A9P7VLV7_9AGAR|nr:uncharacterized protein BT62DRAFT_973158 [Guyanagaster necrorhizus MCA 3950]KAG7442857.1 hypothetical protein BT62DRAFT_973158 [Guyanagaster necrorhizus MCA 3950]
MTDITAEPFSVGSLYLAGFTQARAPHVGLMIPTTATEGVLVHIRIDRAVSPTWTLQTRVQKIAGDMFLSSLLCISAAGITVDQLKSAAQTVHVPENDEFGECFPWAQAVVHKLHDEELLQLKSMPGLVKEFDEFSAGNKVYARRDRFPNVAVSQFCA